ncbi:MAG: TolC family protein, partial [Albimonas sp.]|uniref:TolC family protein n=1 Tax=Albimonas sp. TaxID=1872425 RepID=UPI0040572F65
MTGERRTARRATSTTARAVTGPATRLTRRGRPVVAALATLCLGGCIVVGPDFVAPAVPGKAGWSEKGGGHTQQRDPTLAWWQTFKDPTLDRLVQQAVAQNLTLQAASLRIFAARAELGVVVGDLYPQSQSIGGEYQRERVSKEVGLARQVDRVVDFNPDFQEWNAGFDASWEIDVWGQVRRGIQAAQANLVATVADRYAVLITITGDVATAYVTIRELEAEIALTRASIAAQDQSLRLTQLQYKEGVTTELDVDEATAFLNSTKAEIPKLQSDLGKAKNALALLLGMPAGDVDALLKPHHGIPRPPAEIGIGIPVELLRRR